MKTDLVVAGYLINGNKVLLIFHKKLKLWLPPGGHIEPNEIPDDAVKREFKEELDLDVELLGRNDAAEGGNKKRQLALPFYANVHSVGDHDHCCFYYLCRLKSPQGLKLNRSELDDFRWFSAEELGDSSVREDVRNIAKKAFKEFNSNSIGK